MYESAGPGTAAQELPSEERGAIDILSRHARHSPLYTHREGCHASPHSLDESTRLHKTRACACPCGLACGGSWVDVERSNLTPVSCVR